MSLFKNARGLSRFMADCGFWRHPKWSPKAKEDRLPQMGLYVACLSHCYEHATDGVLPGPDAEELALALGLRPRYVKAPLAGLIARGSLIAHDDHLEVRDFIEHNPTRADIESHREKRRDAGKKGAQARWGTPEDGTCDGESDGTCHAVATSSADGNEETKKEQVRAPFEDDFNAVWVDYPRKDARIDALKAYQARRRDGVDPNEFVEAVPRFVEEMIREGRPRDKIMLGKTFFGPGERWKDYLPAPAASPALGLYEPDPEPVRHYGAPPAWECPINTPGCHDGRVLGDDNVIRRCACGGPRAAVAQ